MTQRRIVVQRVARSRSTARAAPIQVLASDEKKMRGLLKSISETEELVKKLVSQDADNRKELMKLMQVYRRQRFEDGNVVAELVHKMGRSTSSIDTEKFRELVSEEDFIACVKVQKAEAEKVLSGKELESITTVVPAKKGDLVLEVASKK